MHKFYLQFKACLVSLIILSSATRFEEYRQLLDRYPETLGPIGNWQEGEIELITDIAEMERIEAATGREVGIVAQDAYWIWLNDPVRFPSGRASVYGRLLWRHSLEGPPGVVVACVDRERQLIYLICNFRHAVRSWELELPGGLREKGESIEEAARREVMEECGLSLSHLSLLGWIAPDSGKTTSVVPVVLAEVACEGVAQPEESEAIAGWIALPIAEVREAMLRGEMVVEIHGKRRNVAVRSGFLAYALLQLDRHLH
jgi:ADP-ribose diphosphatase